MKEKDLSTFDPINALITRLFLPLRDQHFTMRPLSSALNTDARFSGHYSPHLIFTTHYTGTSLRFPIPHLKNRLLPVTEMGGGTRCLLALHSSFLFGLDFMMMRNLGGVRWGEKRRGADFVPTSLSSSSSFPALCQG